MKILLLTEDVRTKVKQPLGRLIAGSSNETLQILKKTLKKEQPTKIFAVGDSVASGMIENDIRANVYVIDNKIMRKPAKPISIKGAEVINTRNLPGTITKEAWEVVKKAAEAPSVTCIVVDGEEDLLTLPVIKFAPNGSAVVYGQPRMGVVLVQVTEEKRKEIESLIEEMEEVD